MVKGAGLVPVHLPNAILSALLTLIKHIVITEGALSAQIPKRIEKLFEVVVRVLALLYVADAPPWTRIFLVAKHLAHQN